LPKTPEPVESNPYCERKGKKMTQVITETEARDMYNDLLDSEGSVKVGYLTFSASEVLETMDPIAYDVGFDDYVDSLTDDDVFVEGMTDFEMDL
jgi:hypothetical protein